MPSADQVRMEIDYLARIGFGDITVCLQGGDNSLVFVEDSPSVKDVVRTLIKTKLNAIAIFGWKNDALKIRTVPGFRTEEMLEMILAEHKRQMLEVEKEQDSGKATEPSRGK